MNVSADARDPNGIPASALPAETAQDQQARSGIAPVSPRHKAGGEEPDMALEPDLPSDGRDAVGEAMIRDLPQSPQLSEPPSQPHPSNQAS